MFDFVREMSYELVPSVHAHFVLPAPPQRESNNSTRATVLVSRTEASVVCRRRRRRPTTVVVGVLDDEVPSVEVRRLEPVLRLGRVARVVELDESEAARPAVDALRQAHRPERAERAEQRPHVAHVRPEREVPHDELGRFWFLLGVVEVVVVVASSGGASGRTEAEVERVAVEHRALERVARGRRVLDRVELDEPVPAVALFAVLGGRHADGAEAATRAEPLAQPVGRGREGEVLHEQRRRRRLRRGRRRRRRRWLGGRPCWNGGGPLEVERDALVPAVRAAPEGRARLGRLVEIDERRRPRGRDEDARGDVGGTEEPPQLGLGRARREVLDEDRRARGRLGLLLRRRRLGREVDAVRSEEGLGLGLHGGLGEREARRRVGVGRREDGTPRRRLAANTPRDDFRSDVLADI
mmetsp:Transcript_5386/g.22242  ORF Transcript_5386/g.22242 Transcript_5386/m.22242 type:complete len:411 (-) Transcript_5386:195-1427(-)